jgi:hypothetical protein
VSSSGAFHYYHYNDEIGGPERVQSYEISQMLSAMAGLGDAEYKVHIEYILTSFWLNKGKKPQSPLKKIVQDINLHQAEEWPFSNSSRKMELEV